MRFSDFLLVSDPTDLDFIVGYTDEQNIRINVLDLFAGQIIGGGTPGYVPVFTAENVIDDSVIFQHGTNIVIGGVDSLGYKLAVSGSLYASNGAVINSTALGADALRVIAVDGDIFVIPNDSGQSISSLRRIAHPPAVLATESATLGQLNTAISNLEGDIEILLDLKVDKSSVGEPNGVASLDATGKIPLSEIPDSIIGQVEYMGTWNAFTNTPTLNPLIPEQKGHYYVVSAAGVFGGVDYQVGDWIISNGVEWQKVDNTDAVTSVFGRIGAILALEADYQSFYPRLSQAYDNPTWINTLAFSKITGVPPFLLENQTITLSGDVTGSGKTSIASTISNNAVTDSKLRDSVGTSVIGRASSTTGDPADIQASTDGHVLQRSGGTLLFGLISSDSIGSIDWSKIINTPTTLSGYGITNAYTKTESDNKFVPYTGANANVNLGSNNITANAFVKAGGTSAQFLKADGSVDVSQYVPTTRSVNAGTGLTGGGNLSSDITLAFDTTWGDTRYAYRTREIIAGTGLLGGGDLSANRTLSFDTVWGDARYLAPLAGYVPYTGATTNVNLGEFGIRAGYVQLDTTPTSTPTAQGTIYWDQDDNTIDAVLNGYIMKIGEDQFYPVKNQTGSPIAKGTAVRFAGTVGASGRLLIQPFIADGSVPSTYFMGVTAETIANGADGKVLWFGRIRGINTNAYNEGDILYASTTVPGGFQTTVPVAPNNIVQVAAVITKHVNNGTIFIRPTLGSNINKDEGVKITSPVVGQLLQLQSGNIWENKSLGQVIGGLSSQFLKGDGSLDSTSYVPFARQITINGTTFDLSANRTWNVGTVTSVGLSVPVGFAVTNSPITSSGNIVLGFDSGYSLPTNAKQLEWDTAYANRIASLTTTGTSGAATFISNVLNIPQYQAQGNYITNLTGEVTANGPGSVSATISNSAVIGKVLTGLSVTGSAILASDTILQAFGKLQGQVNGLVGGLQYQGTWNANTNTPTLTSGVGTDGHFYIVSVAGNTTIDGLSNWQVGDWIVFHTPSWQKVDNTESVTSVNGQVGAVNLSTTEIPEGTNLYFTNARSRQSISLTTTGSSGAATYNNSTGVFNIPQYSLSGLGGVPTTRSLTINGVTFDLSADRSWTVGDVRTDVVYTNPSFIGTLAWGKITGTPTTLAGYGITDAYTQTQVNNLLAGYVTLATDQTITGLKTIVRSGDVLSFKIGTDTLYGLKVAYNQNELVPSGEATWSFVNTFNRNGVGYEVTPLSFFRGVLVTGERLLTSSINSNLLDYYSNNPSGRYPVYAYNTGVQQFSTGILVGYTTGLVNASTGAISQLPSGVVANFNGRVIGQSAANSNEFVTLSQLGSYIQGSGTTNTLPKFTGSTTIGNSLFTDNGTNGAIGGTNYSGGTGVRSFNISAPLYAGLAFWVNDVYASDIFSYVSTGNLIISADPTNVLASSRLILSVDGTNRVVVLANGNVGIGDITASAKLEIQTASGAEALALSGYQLLKWDLGDQLWFGGYNAGQWSTLKFATSGSERFRVTSSGNLDFNINGSQSYIHLNQGTSTDGGLIFRRNNANTWQLAQSTSGNNLLFYSYGVADNVLTLNNSTRAATFTGILSVSRAAMTTQPSYSYQNILVTSGFGGGYTDARVQSLLAGYDGNIYGVDIGYSYDAPTNTGYSLRFSTNDDLTGNPIERLRINSTGAATFSSSVTAASGNILAATPQLDFTLNVNTAFKHSIVASNFASSPVSSNTLDFRVANGANSQVVAMTLNGSGNVLIGTTTLTTVGGFTNARVLIKSIAEGPTGGGLQIEQSSTDNVAYFGFTGSAFRIGTSYRVTGSYQPILFDSNGNANQLFLSTSNNVLIGTTSDNGARLQVSGTATFSSSVTIRDGLIINPLESLLHTQNGALSYYSTTNGVYLNGAGASGWLRLNAAGTENDRNSINIFGSTASSPNSISFRTNNNTALTIASSGAATFSSSVTANGISSIGQETAFTFQRTTGIPSDVYSLNADSGSAYLYNNTTANILMYWREGGNVGIGAFPSNSKLLVAGTHVSGNSIIGVLPIGNNTATIGLYNASGVRRGMFWSDTGFVRVESDSDQIQIAPAGIITLTLATSGLSTFSGQLNVTTSSTTGYLRVGGGNGAGESRVFIEANGNNSYIDSYGDNAYKPLQIQANHLILNSASGGNVLVGTSTNGGYRLDVAGQIRSFSASPLVVSMTSNPSASAIVSARWTSGVGMNMSYFPDFAQGFIDNTYPVTAGEVYGDIYFRQNVSGTMTTRMTIQARTGNVSIGTDTANQRLTVNGFVRASGLSLNEIGGTVSGFIGYEKAWIGSGSSNSVAIAAEGGNNINFYTGGSSVERVRFNNSSIHTNPNNTAFSMYLHLNRQSTQDGGILLSTDNSLDWQIVNANRDLWFYSYGLGTTAFRVMRNTGNFLIGTTTDGGVNRVLSVQRDQNDVSSVAMINPSTGSAASAQFIISANNSSGFYGAFSSTHSTTNWAGRSVFGTNALGGGITISAHNSGQDIRFLTESTSNIRMVVASNGNVLINTTDNPGATLHVNGTIRTGQLPGAIQNAVNWRLGTARGGPVTSNATVRVEIDGVLVDLLARYV